MRVQRGALSSFIIIFVLASSGLADTIETFWTGVSDSYLLNTSNWTPWLPAPATEGEGLIGGYAGFDPVVTGTGNEIRTLYVGIANGDGYLKIASGAELLLTPGRDLTVGSTRGGTFSGDGVVDVNDGATITVMDDFRVGQFGDANGTVNLYGTINCHNFWAGDGGIALVDIRGDGVLLIDETPGTIDVAAIKEHVDNGRIAAYGIASYNPADPYYLQIETFVGEGPSTRTGYIGQITRIRVKVCDVYYVDDDAVGDPGPGNPEVSDPNENGSYAYPFDTIQEGVDAALAGQRALVLPVSYAEPGGFTEVVSIDKNIRLTSMDPTDPDIVNSTVIRGSVVFGGTEDANCIFTGFKIQDPNYGVVFGNGTHATISYCNITGNGPCLATVIQDCDGIISNCLITDNATFSPCGVYPVIYGCHGVIKNCTIANNISRVSPADGETMTIENCIIYNNGGVQFGVGTGATLNISYSSVEGGLAGIAGSGDVNWEMGNIDVDPCFVRLGVWNGPELIEGNYHLKSSGWRLSEYDPDWTFDSVTSRCIDAGNPSSGFGDELMSVPRDINNGYGINLRVNMGAYGGTNQASMAPYDWVLLGDLSNDGTVAYEDLAGQIENWLTIANEQPGDLNRDGIVDILDYAILAEDWMRTTDWAE